MSQSEAIVYGKNFESLRKFAQPIVRAAALDMGIDVARFKL